MNKTKILLVGAGKMGLALMMGWLKAGVQAENIFVVDPFANVSVLDHLKVVYNRDISKLPNDLDYCVFAVKPQNFDEVLSQYKDFVNDKCIFISIAAGKTISKMEALLGKNAKIVRAMPNLPATLGAGITAIYANPKVSVPEKGAAMDLLSTVGDVIDLRNESQMDIVTAISGSGPAYIFHIIEALDNIGVKLGLDKETALLLAKGTVHGAAAMAQFSQKAPADLRADVTSKGGTTEAALGVLMKDNELENLLQEAINAAIARAKELQ